ncbi:MAG TPA: hypothetical protein VHD84_00480 [Candidatus Saccharimonadales bacterium]|nr:hypothetical protein [Candidatus Saccharimonadales bacterium]
MNQIYTELSSSQITDEIGRSQEFVIAERGQIDQIDAAANLAGMVSPQQAAYEFARDPSRQNKRGFYEILRHNDGPDRLAAFRTHMAGRMVIVLKLAHLFPAVVSVDKDQTAAIKLHIFENLWRPGGLTALQRYVLSGTAQAETKGVGEHGRLSDDKVEAEHFLGLLNGAARISEATTWRRGIHPNHSYRGNNSSVPSRLSEATAESPGLIPGGTITTVSFSRLPAPQVIYWHEDLLSERGIETGDQPDALKALQGLGYISLLEQKKDDNLRALLAV